MDKHLNFKRMIKDIGKGLFDVVIAWKLDRSLTFPTVI